MTLDGGAAAVGLLQSVSEVTCCFYSEPPEASVMCLQFSFDLQLIHILFLNT